MHGHAPQVFISYHRSDLAAAERVRAHLVANHVRTWMDRYDIPVGTYWPDEIDRGLVESRFVLGLLSPDSVESRNVKNEWDWALQNGKQLVLLKTHPCVVPHRYVSVNFIEADAGRFEQALGELVRLPGLVTANTDEALPATRYARSGDVSIAYQQFGTGPIDMVWVPGSYSHCEHTWRLPVIAEHFRRLGKLARVILFDKRGIGMSDRVSAATPLEERMDDIRAVMDACGVGRAVIFGLSDGVPLSLLFAATYPQRTESLVLFGGYASEARKEDYPWVPTLDERRDALDAEARTLHEVWGTEAQGKEKCAVFAPSLQDDRQAVRWMADLLRLGASPGASLALNRMNLLVDVRDLLPTVQVPTLVFHRTGDRACLVQEGRYVADRVPGATFVELPGNDHIPWAGEQDQFFRVLKAFLERGDEGTDAATEPDSVLATVVVVLATGAQDDELAARAQAASLRFRGRIAHGDDGAGLVATFDGPARAIRFAGAICQDGTIPNGSVRAGIHVGEVAAHGTRVIGRPVDVARNLATVAQSGQILTTGIVRDLANGSEIRFRGTGDDHLTDVWEGMAILAVDSGSVA